MTHTDDEPLDSPADDVTAIEAEHDRLADQLALLEARKAELETRRAEILAEIEGLESAGAELARRLALEDITEDELAQRHADIAALRNLPGDFAAAIAVVEEAARPVRSARNALRTGMDDRARAATNAAAVELARSLRRGGASLVVAIREASRETGVSQRRIERLL